MILRSSHPGYSVNQPSSDPLPRTRSPGTSALLLVLLACPEPPETRDAGPDCIPADCTELDAECGTLIQGDRCLLCGSCTAPETCGGGGRARHCGCTPRECDGITCGPLDPGCDLGLPPLDCGCTAPMTCGGAGQPNSCGRVVSRGEECDPEPGSSKICPTGLRCCPGPFRGPSLCLETCDPLPDLVVHGGLSRIEVLPRFFAPDDCAYTSDQCVYGVGTRSLLYFEIGIANSGTADLDLGRPADDPSRFLLDQCAAHEHYHFPGFIRQRLVNLDDTLVPEAPEVPKVGWCLRDTHRVDPRAPLIGKFPDDDPSRNFYTSCTVDPQGISMGWKDVYDANDPCQWIDVTDVPSGEYKIEVVVNPDHLIQELSFDNNVASATVTIP
ncbi:MAG: hypothetical protein HY791_26680 [Deltaproteobacteria bacterium]|nr:hypothetical protein [Deltaproteobacteria bacterium]